MRCKQNATSVSNNHISLDKSLEDEVERKKQMYKTRSMILTISLNKKKTCPTIRFLMTKREIHIWKEKIGRETKKIGIEKSLILLIVKIEITNY